MGHCFIYVIGAFLFTGASALGWAASWFCKFVTTGENTYYGILLQERESANCVSLDGMSLETIELFEGGDTLLLISRWSAIVALFISATGTVNLWLGMCCGCADSKNFRRWMGVFALLCATLQGLLFLILESDTVCSEGKCTIDVAAFLNIASMSLFVVAAIVCCLVPDVGTGYGNGTGLY